MSQPEKPIEQGSLNIVIGPLQGQQGKRGLGPHFGTQETWHWALHGCENQFTTCCTPTDCIRDTHCCMQIASRRPIWRHRSAAQVRLLCNKPLVQQVTIGLVIRDCFGRQRQQPVAAVPTNFEGRS